MRRSVVRRLLLQAVVVGLCLILAAYLGAFLPGGAREWASWSMIAGIALTLSGTIGYAGCTGRQIRRSVLGAAGFLFAILISGFSLALALPANIDAELSLLGIPFRASIVLLGIGIVPFLVLPFLYAADFDETELSVAALGVLRTECARLRSGLNDEDHE